MSVPASWKTALFLVDKNGQLNVPGKSSLRLIGTVRREYLDRTLFWTTVDLEAKLTEFQHYYNGHRTHHGLEGRLPEDAACGQAGRVS